MSEFGMFLGKDSPDIVSGWKLYEDGRAYKNRINLYDTVRVNNNFVVGKQWEGVESNGLPTPQINILKRTVGFTVATVTTDNIKVTASPLSNTPLTDELTEPARIVNEEFEAIAERNKLPALVKEFGMNAAIDGDGCFYTYWNDDIQTGQKGVNGAICTEVIDNTKVFFGNPADRRVQTQPWIMIASDEIVRRLRMRAKKNGFSNYGMICPDSNELDVDAVHKNFDTATLLLLMWRDDETGHIKSYEFTRNCAVAPEKDLGISLYPVCWMSWDRVKNSFHGQAMVTGLIPNQISINKTIAQSQLSIAKTAFPKVIYDKTRVKAWDNRVGGAIGVAGGDMNGVAKIMDPAPISPQISQFVEMLINETQSSLGANGAAIGDARPDNAAAIISLQRAAATPSEMTKQNLYQSIEDLFRIYLEFMAEYYGRRLVDIETPAEMRRAYEFAGMEAPNEIPVEFDFNLLKQHPMILKLDVGASSYYSEIASLQTLDNLLMNKHISPLQYLERIPDGYIPARRALIAEIKGQEQMAQGMMPMPEGATPQGGGEVLGDEALGIKPEIPVGGGFSALQRKVVESGDTKGIV